MYRYVCVFFGVCASVAESLPQEYNLIGAHSPRPRRSAKEGYSLRKVQCCAKTLFERLGTTPLRCGDA